MSEAVRQRGVAADLIRRRGGPATLFIPNPTAGTDPWNPGPEGTPTSVPCRAFISDYTASQRSADANIAVGDKLAIVSAPIMNGSVEVVPAMTHWLVQGGTTYSIESIKPLNVDGVTNILYELRVSR